MRFSRHFSDRRWFNWTAATPSTRSAENLRQEENHPGAACASLLVEKTTGCDQSHGRLTSLKIPTPRAPSPERVTRRHWLALR